MISNSVTYLWSYTNSAIGNRRYRQKLRADVSASSADIVASDDLRAIADVAPNADVSTSSADVLASSDDIVASNDDCSSVS